MSKFVITGGAGYIGGYMTIRLLQDGHIVKVIDKNPKNSSTLLSTLNDVNFSYLEIISYQFQTIQNAIE